MCLDVIIVIQYKVWFKYLGKNSKKERIFLEQSGIALFIMKERDETKDYTIHYVVPPKVEQQTFKDMEENVKAKNLRGSNSFANSDSNSFASDSNSSVNSRFGGRRRKTLRKTRKRGTRKSIGSPN